MKTLLMTTSLVLLLAAAPATRAADAGNGAKLVGEHCSGCHDDSIYTRKDRRVTSLDGLKKQVKRCELSLGLKWFDDEVNDVVDHLNRNYYKF